MADSAAPEVQETTPVVEKETVTSSVKESPVKETNGTVETPEKAENGTKNGKSKENGSEETEENEKEEEEVVCPIKRKSCSGDEVADVTTPEKKQKVIEETNPVEETEEPVEA